MAISLDSDSDNDLPPPPKNAHSDAAAPIDLSDDEDDLPPPKPAAGIAIEDSINLVSNAVPDSLVVPPRAGSGGGIDLDDDDEDDLPPPPKPATAAQPQQSAAPQKSAAAAPAPKPAPKGKAAATAEANRPRANTAKPRRAISDVSVEAFLFKQSPSWPYVMQKRWVTLKGRLLSYFEEKTSPNPSGTLDLKGAHVVESPQNAKAPHALGITGETPALKGRTFIFAASNREEYLHWLEILKFVTTEPKNNELHWFEKMATGMF